MASSEILRAHADRVAKLLNGHDIRRTDLRFADLLSALPPENSSLVNALKALKRGPPDDQSSLALCLQAVEERLLEFQHVKLQDELIEGVRPLFENPEEHLQYIQQMGWIDGHIMPPAHIINTTGIDSASLAARNQSVCERVRAAGLYAPKLFTAIQLIEKFVPKPIDYINYLIKTRGLSKLRFDRWTLLAAAEVVGIPHVARYLTIGKKEYFSAVRDKWYPQLVVRDAKHSQARWGSVWIPGIVRRISNRIGQSIDREDVRVVLLERMIGLEWLDKEHTTFRFEDITGSDEPMPWHHSESPDAAHGANVSDAR